MNLQAVLNDTVVKPAMFTVLLNNELYCAVKSRLVTVLLSIVKPDLYAFVLYFCYQLNLCYVQ